MHYKKLHGNMSGHSATSVQQKFVTVCRYSLTVPQCIGAVV